jgi:hypothetical protein
MEKPLARQSESLRGNQKVGMFRPKVCTQRNDLAIAEAEGPQGPEAHTDLLCEVRAYTKFLFSTYFITSVQNRINK